MSFPYILHCSFTDEVQEITKVAMMGSAPGLATIPNMKKTPLQPGVSPPMPSYAKGGIVKYKKGGKIVRVAEQGDEAIIPLEDKKNAKRIAKKILKKG